MKSEIKKRNPNPPLSRYVTGVSRGFFGMNEVGVGVDEGGIVFNTCLHYIAGFISAYELSTDAKLNCHFGVVAVPTRPQHRIQGPLLLKFPPKMPGPGFWRMDPQAGLRSESSLEHMPAAL